MAEYRLIDANAFIEYLGLEDTEEAREENYAEIVTLEDFDKQETIDAMPVVHGHWVVDEIRTVSRMCHCSECMQKKCLPRQSGFNYCSNCGAKMDGKDGVE